MMKWFWDSFCPILKNVKKYMLSLQASVDQLKGFPPALVQTAENDVLRDEGEMHVRKLNEAGVGCPYTTQRSGLTHDYGLLNPLADIPSVQTSILQAAAVIKDKLK
ncbi:acetyl esterase/lipase [Chryseobacterium jejuense]|nr:acetyl esterase/lipase [Chryseobacterium jejuense]